MSTPFIGEIRMVAYSHAPSGWALCNGQLLPINQNEALYTLIGTQYGGDGEETFGLPDFRGRGPLHQGTGPGLSARGLGQQGGVEQVILTAAQLPPHEHDQPAGAKSTSKKPFRRAPAVGGAYADPGRRSMAPTGVAGEGQPHENMPPFVVVNFIIALQGVFPAHG